MRYDIKNGILYNWKKFIPVILIFAYAAIYVNVNNKGITPSMGDYLVMMFQGIEPYNFLNPTTRFEIPILWLLFNLYLTYMVGYYPFIDMNGFGKLSMIKQKGRVRWWINKCVWNVLTVCIYYIVGILTFVVFSVVNGNLSFSTNSKIISLISGGVLTNIDISSMEVLELCLILPLAVSIGISLFQMCMALIIKPVYSNMLIIGVMIFSVYYCREFFVDNYLMLMRNSKIIGEVGVNTEMGLILGLGLSLISIIAGMEYIKRKDILNYED